MQYAVSNNFGSLTTKGNTEIYGSQGQVAFDIWYGMNKNGLYDDGVKVNLGMGTLVDGTIEIGAAERAANSTMSGKIQLKGLEDATLQNNTIKLTSDIWFNGLKVAEGQTVNFDLNGKTFHVSNGTVGSTGTQTNGFQLLKNSTVTFKNGTLTSDVAKLLIQNYSNLTLDKMVVDGTSLAGSKPYTLSTNNGATLVKDTTIIGNSNGFAFDVCSFGSYTSNAVTVEGDSVINGKIELSRTNTASLALNLNGGTFSNASIVVAADGDAAVVTKAGAVTLAAPAGYKWSNNKLVKEDKKIQAAVTAPTSQTVDQSKFVIANTNDSNKNVVSEKIESIAAAMNAILDAAPAADVSKVETALDGTLTLDTKPTGMKATVSNNKITVSSYTFDVSPRKNGEAVGGNNNAFKSGVTFRLPLPYFTSSQAVVTHGEDAPVVYTVKGSNPEDKYIEVTATHFSEFKVEGITITIEDNCECLNIPQVQTAKIQGQNILRVIWHVLDASDIYPVESAGAYFVSWGKFKESSSLSTINSFSVKTVETLSTIDSADDFEFYIQADLENIPDNGKVYAIPFVSTYTVLDAAVPCQW